MGDLISRAELYKAWDALDKTQCPNLLIDAMIRETQDAPAVDAVEVVRCRDCKWWVKLADYMPGLCASNLKWTAENWYCASGEIKEAESDV